MTPTWIIHFIPCGQPSYHTHGLDRYGSLELELNLPLDLQQATLFINLIANEVAEKSGAGQVVPPGRSGPPSEDILHPPPRKQGGHCLFLGIVQLHGVGLLALRFPRIFTGRVAKQDAKHAVILPAGLDRNRFKQVKREIEHIILPIYTRHSWPV